MSQQAETSKVKPIFLCYLGQPECACCYRGFPDSQLNNNDICPDCAGHQPTDSPCPLWDISETSPTA